MAKPKLRHPREKHIISVTKFVVTVYNAPANAYTCVLRKRDTGDEILAVKSQPPSNNSRATIFVFKIPSGTALNGPYAVLARPTAPHQRDVLLLPLLQIQVPSVTHARRHDSAAGATISYPDDPTNTVYYDTDFVAYGSKTGDIGTPTMVSNGLGVNQTASGADGDLYVDDDFWCGVWYQLEPTSLESDSYYTLDVPPPAGPGGPGLLDFSPPVRNIQLSDGV